MVVNQVDRRPRAGSNRAALRHARKIRVEPPPVLAGAEQPQRPIVTGASRKRGVELVDGVVVNVARSPSIRVLLLPREKRTVVPIPPCPPGIRAVSPSPACGRVRPMVARIVRTATAHCTASRGRRRSSSRERNTERTDPHRRRTRRCRKRNGRWPCDPPPPSRASPSASCPVARLARPERARADVIAGRRAAPGSAASSTLRRRLRRRQREREQKSTTRRPSCCRSTPPAGSRPRCARSPRRSSVRRCR